MKKRSLMGIVLAVPIVACTGGSVSAQYYTQYASAQAPPSPQSPAPVPGGCYTGTVGGGACYTVTPHTGHWSCYSGGHQGNHTPFVQHPPNPYYDVLCHDTAETKYKVTLNRYYPVYVHLKHANNFEGVHIEEKWQPVCILCTKAKPCPKHANGQMPADLPSPASEPSALNDKVPANSDADGPAPPMIQQAVNQPNASPAGPAAGTNPSTVVQPSPSQPADTAASSSTANVEAAAPAKQWIWLAYEGVWGYGYQRTDGYWEIDPGSRRSAAPGS